MKYPPADEREKELLREAELLARCDELLERARAIKHRLIDCVRREMTKSADTPQGNSEMQSASH